MSQILLCYTSFQPFERLDEKAFAVSLPCRILLQGGFPSPHCSELSPCGRLLSRKGCRGITVDVKGTFQTFWSNVCVFVPALRRHLEPRDQRIVHYYRPNGMPRRRLSESCNGGKLITIRLSKAKRNQTHSERTVPRCKETDLPCILRHLQPLTRDSG